MAKQRQESIPMTPPLTPTASMKQIVESPEKGPYIMTSTPEGMTPLQRHCAFFDLDNDGILVPWHTFAAFRELGYGLFFSLLGTALVHLFFSYPTSESWMPDPFFSIHLKNIHRCIHGSDSGAYNNFGELTTTPVDAVMTRFDVEQKAGLGFGQGVKMLGALRDINDPFGWMAAILEWGFLWVLAADRDGVVSFDAIRSQYDGTLFYKIRENRQSLQ